MVDAARIPIFAATRIPTKVISHKNLGTYLGECYVKNVIPETEIVIFIILKVMGKSLINVML